MSPIDKKKRQTLKSFAAASAGLAASSVGLTHANNAAGPASAHPLPSTFKSELDITIVNSSNVVENTVMLRNNTTEPMSIDRIRAGKVVFSGKEVDLSVLTQHGSLCIDSGRTLSINVNVRPVSSDSEVEYLWAQQCTSELGENSEVVDLGGFLVDKDVIVFPSLT